MSEAEGPPATDMVYFGGGGSDLGVRSDLGEEESNRLPQTLGHESAGSGGPESQAPRGPSRALAAVDRHHGSLLLGSGWISVTALVVAALGWATGDPRTAPPVTGSVDESHGLSSDQAACFAFSRVESRVKAVLGSQSPIGVGPERHEIVSEIRRLDVLAADYPSADYRLVAAFADVADASVRLSQARETRDFEQLAVERFTALTHVRDACRSIADFDTGTSSVRKGE
ncbi:MAG: hypothetical protein ACR2LE_11070 [Nocardioidaceae bacterium]